MKKGSLSLFVCALLLGACQSSTTASSSIQITQSESITQVSTDLSDVFGNYQEVDFQTEYDEETATKIIFGDTTKIEGEGAESTDNIVSITQGGTYILSGSATNGQLKVNVSKEDSVHLIFDGVTLSNDFGPAIWIEEADQVIATLVTGTVNTFTDASEYQNQTEESKEDAVFYSQADLTINGSGTLAITGNYKNGLVSKDDLVLISGVYQIEAVKDAVVGKDMVSIYDGDYTLTTQEGDGIKANNDSESEKGYVAIEGGLMTIQAGRDGIQAETSLKIQEATLQITTASGANSTDLIDEESYKGLKAGTEVLITSGDFTVDSADDSLHTNGDIEITGGTFSLASGDDGIHADQTLTLAGGTIAITQSVEGLEAASIQLVGSDVEIVASDDGINASDGSSTSTEGAPGGFGAVNEDLIINITAGQIVVDAQGDGVDSNGNITMSGGTLIVNGTTSGGDGALDYDGTFDLTGGTLVAVGSSAMAQTVSDSSSQGTVSFYLDQKQSANQMVSLFDASNELLLAFTPIRDYQFVVISTPDLVIDQSYTLHLGGTATGDAQNGLVTDGSVADSQLTTSFTLEATVSAFNQSGEAASTQGMMGGAPGMMGGGGPGQMPNAEGQFEPGTPPNSNQ
ncbi:carbohydrate-binding domain-containing protein [Enterococcus lemanii]|uniref:Carbohydrate-binding domain-containing protein n=1 Tax=Enterococcus lemanii TaxID=1159752 RepID=A0ABV9MTL4_9ENTE|nr:carbohydrate-binding domain-containing protein [Enterococcus lemanii]MBM7708874.1 hypothetical protein [Enterococcus lemanii]